LQSDEPDDSVAHDRSWRAGCERGVSNAVEDDRVAQDDERQKEVERDEVGIQFEEDNETAKDDLCDQADD